MGTTLPCRGRLPLSGNPLHARYLVGRKDQKRPAVTAVASPPHKYAKQGPSGDAQSAASAFNSDSIRLCSAPRASQAGNHLDSQRSVQAHASNQQSLNISTLWGNYTRSVETNPVLTKACTSFFGFVLGDVLAQRLTGADFSVLRCLRLGTYGLTLDGPLGHIWYQILDKTVWPNDPQSNKAVLAKTAADQLIWAPVMTCVFFAVLKALEGHPELIMQTIQVRAYLYGNILVLHLCLFKGLPQTSTNSLNKCCSNTLDCICRTSWSEQWSPTTCCGLLRILSTSSLCRESIGSCTTTASR